MNEPALAAQTRATAHSNAGRSALLQRRCACGMQTKGGGECAECGKRKFGLQRKLFIGASDDPLELEADRVAHQVLGAPPDHAVSGVPPRIQGFTGQPAGQTAAVPASVDQALAGPGRPLDPSLREDMERRFGHDFSRVRVHTDSRAAESARSVYARAYTAGSHIVFGAGQFEPSSTRGRELLAHELAHTVQQCSAGGPPPSLAQGGVSERRAEFAARDAGSLRPLLTALPAGSVVLARAPVPIDAYTDDMLARALAEVRHRLVEKSYSGRDRDVDLHMALKRENDKRARVAAVAEADAYLESIEPQPPTEEPYKVPTKFRPGGFTDEDIDPEAKQRAGADRKRTEQDALDRKREEESRPARLALVRRYLILHGLRKGDEAEVLTHFLTVSDLRVLRKNGLEPRGFFTRNYAEKIIEVIDGILPRDPMEDRANLEDLQRRAAAVERTAEKIEGLSSEGPHALAGRIEGALVAYAAGKDPLAGSEMGAAFGGLLGARAEMRYGMPRLTGRVEPYAAPMPEPVSMKLPEKPGLTFPRWTDVTKSGPFSPVPTIARPNEPTRPKPGQGPLGKAGSDPKTFKASPTTVPPAAMPKGRRIKVVVNPPKPAPSGHPGVVRQGPLSPAEDRIRVLANKDVYVGVQARIKVRGEPVTEGLGGAAFGELDATRGTALGGSGRAAVLPEVSQPPKTPARKGSQPSSGLIVEPTEGATELEVLAWNTGAPQRGANVSHAERQIIEWFRSRDAKWKGRVTSVDVEVFGREICTSCDADIKALQRAYPNIRFNWVRRDTGHPLKSPPTPRRSAKDG